MATNYPGGLDSLTNPSSGDALDSPSHAGQHTNANDAIEAIETELGTNPKGTFTTVRARLDNIELTGAGSPEGAVTASPGARYLQTSATTDVKGWIKWVKATGTGNTGWVAGPEADTGRRDVTASLINGWASSGGGGKLILRRIGNQVTLTGYEPGLTAASKTSNTFYNPASGFSAPWQALGAYGLIGVALNHGTSAMAPVIRESSSGLTIVGATTSWTSVSMNITWTTEDWWPSSLPGSAA